jgi:uncharacterized protein YndB with AHSA1/START domain
MDATASTAPHAASSRSFLDTEVRLERFYPHPRAKVWKALTDPRLIAAWLMRPDGFEPRVGCKFRLTAKPQPGWRGYVDCEVVAVEEGHLLQYTWVGDESGNLMTVTWRLEDAPGGARLYLLHEGFHGVGGFLLAKVMMGPGWKKMMTRHIASVLDRLGDDGSFTSDPKLDKSGG